MIKRLILSCALALVSVVLFGQAKKPTLMVVPADNWCVANEFVTTVESKGKVTKYSDYRAALQNSADCNNVITKINALMSDRSFPLKDLSSVMKNLKNNAVMDAVTVSEGGSALAESPLDQIKKIANADIMIELNWQVNTVGPKRSITYSLAAKDTYTDKQIAGAQGTGAPSFSAETAVLLEEAVVANMDVFCSQLQSYFDDMMENGREVALEVKVLDDGSGLNLYKAIGDDELTDVIDNWVSDNTVNHRYNLSSGSENFLKFEQVRIPLYQANGRPNDTRRWARELSKELRVKYQIPSRVDIRGLGKAVLLIGE